jgi:EpsG family
MLPYWLLFLVPAFLAVLRPKPRKLRPVEVRRLRTPFEWKLIFVLLVLMIGLRHQVGGDWESYVGEIERIVEGSMANSSKVQDPMYTLFNWAAASSGLGVYLVNFLSAIFFSWGLIVFCREQTRPWLALTVAVPYLITVVAMGYTRQGAAIGIAMIGMVALERGSSIKFILWIALAATFHKSAIILVPLAVLSSTRHRFLTIFWVLAAGLILYVLLLLESVDFLIKGYIEDAYQSSGAAIRIAMNAVPAALFLIFRSRFEITPAQRSFWTLMSLSSLLFIVLLLISPSSTAVDRVALYWIPIQLFVLSRLPDALGRKGAKNLGWANLVVVYSAAVHFIWLVYADTAFAWLPYQFYPWSWLWN